MTVRADSAVNAKDFSAAFFHISSLKKATQVTTLPRQNNQIHFGFGKNIYIYFSQNQNEFGCFNAAVLLLVSRFLKN